MTLPELAKLAVETYIKEGKIIEPPKDLALPEEFLKKRAGVFVTIEKAGQLRGCIGTYLPTRPNIAQEVIRNAIAAAAEDWRFGPVQEKELDSLTYTVYILSNPEPVKDVKELNPKKFGVIVKNAPFVYPNQKEITIKDHLIPKMGLLLPDLKEIDTVEQQLSIACQKAGINPQKENFFVYKFTVQKYQ